MPALNHIPAVNISVHPHVVERTDHGSVHAPRTGHVALFLQPGGLEQNEGTKRPEGAVRLEVFST